MPSKKFSEFTPAAAFDSDWFVVGYDPAEATLEQANKRVTWANATALLATTSALATHTGDATIHVTLAQSSALDAASSPSGANPFLTVSAADLAYDAAGAAAAVQANLNTHTGAASPHTGHLISVVGGTNVTIDNTDPQNPIINATGGGGGHTIQDEGTPLTQRTNLNFIGAGVIATDNAGNDATDVTIPGGLTNPLTADLNVGTYKIVSTSPNDIIFEVDTDAEEFIFSSGGGSLDDVNVKLDAGNAGDALIYTDEFLTFQSTNAARNIAFKVGTGLTVMYVYDDNVDFNFDLVNGAAAKVGRATNPFNEAHIDTLFITDDIVQLEIAAPTETAGAGKGIWWVRNDSPTTPMFRDSSGVDHELNAAGGGAITLLDMTPLTDGLSYDKPEFSVVNDTGLQLDLEKLGGGDLKVVVNGADVTLDCTTGSGSGGKARVALTAGSDANTPALNYIYITNAGAGVGQLNASTTAPTGAFAWVGMVLVPDATTWNTVGNFLIQRFTESDNDDRGQISHEREKLRMLGALYDTGATSTLDITTNVGVPDTVHCNITAGTVYQLHKQTWPAFATGPYHYGNGLDQYERITDLSSALAEQDGTSLSGTFFNLVIWGAVNKTTGDCKVFVNLPNGSYNSSASAIADVNNTADYSVPLEMRSVAFMIARIVLRHQVTSGGTWTDLGIFSLLGTPPGVRTGGASAVAANEFADDVFRVFDNGDATKQIALEASNITTGTTRTITMPDRNVDLDIVGKLTLVSAPATPTSSGEVGQAAFDGTYFYLCTATNTWGRFALITSWT